MIRYLVLLVAAILVTSCNNLIVDKAGEPFRVVLQAKKISASSASLVALVDYGSMGVVPVTVEFFQNNISLGSVSENTPLVATIQEPWDYKFVKDFQFKLDTDYNLFAKVKWISGGIEKSIVSDVVVQKF